MIKKQLVQRAEQIARAKASAASGRRADIRDVNQPRTGIKRKADERGDLAKRLAAYHEAIQAAKDHDPPCPDCWLERGEQLAMASITIDTLDEVQLGCMECGFEASFLVRSIGYWVHMEQDRKRSSAA